MRPAHRAHEAGECAASECSLLCNDLLRLGRSHFLIDPSVRLAYRWREAQDVGRAAAVGLNSSSWARVLGSLDGVWPRIASSQQIQVRRGSKGHRTVLSCWRLVVP